MNSQSTWSRWGAIAVLLLAVSSGCRVAATGNNLEGRRAFEQGQYARAIDFFHRALRNDPRNADAHYNLAATYHTMGKQAGNGQWLHQAEQLYRESIGLDEQHVDAHRALAVLLIETQREAQAFDLVRTWRARQPNSPEPLVELARLHQEYGDGRQAAEYLADALRVDSNHVRALKAMGGLREAEGRYDLALENYRRAYFADNMQTEVAARIAQLEGRLQALPTQGQPGQNRFGSAQHYVPR